MTLEEVVENRIRQSQTLADMAYVLQMLFENHSISDDGHLISIRALVGHINGMRIEIYPKEHPPAHFHIRGGDINASFAIEDGRCLEGTIGGREQALVRFWYKNARHTLIEIWNHTRPSDCQVGPIYE